MNPTAIILLSFGHFGRAFLQDISDAVFKEFDCPVIVKEAHVDLSGFYDPGRRQYNADKLLREVDSRPNLNASKVIGLFDVDLFIPILTYIFGQAQLGGQTAIASVFRLSNELYGMKKDDVVLLNRFKKEIIHELGHAFGLIHCYTTACVMRSSTYVEDIDQKDVHLCIKCRSNIGLS